MAITWDVTIDGHKGDLMPVEEWLEDVKNHSFIDYDGFGLPVGADGHIIPKVTNPLTGEGYCRPSKAAQLPEGTTHILWFNR